MATSSALRIRIGVTLRAAALLWWRNRRAFATLAVVIVTPLVVVTQLLSNVPESSPFGLKVSVVIAVLTASVLGEIFCAGLAEHTVRHQQLGGPPEPWWRTAQAVPLVRLAAVSFIVAGLVLVGLLLLIIPGLLVFAWLSMATPLVSLERARIWASLRGSVRMIRGRFWSVLVLTTATFVPAALGDAATDAVRDAHAPLWTELVVEIVTDVLAVSLTAAMVVAIFNALGGGRRA